MAEKEITFERWKANTMAAGIEASREEFDEILDGGLSIRLEWLNTVLELDDLATHPPDFLQDTTQGGAEDE